MALRLVARYKPALVMGALVLSGCDYDPPWPPDGRVYDMTDAGVVESVEEVASGWRVMLANGEEVAVGTANLHEGSIEPDDLLILATSPGGEYGPATLNAYATLRSTTVGYYLDEPARDDGAHIVFRSGLRLPKASEFDPGPIDDGHFPSFREGFCVNTAGEVIGYGTACP